MNSKEYSAAYYQKYKDRIKERTSQYAKAHRVSRAEYFREYRKRNPETSEHRHKRGLWEKFKMTPEEYQSMFDSQNGKCAICKSPEVATRNGSLKRAPVDHDHVTGKVREILCARCNTVIGLLDEDTKLVSEVYAYLIRHGNPIKELEPAMV